MQYKAKYFEGQEFKDKFGRELDIGNKCLRVTTKANSWVPKIEIVNVQSFSKFKVKIGERRYVDSNNLILLSSEGL